MTIFTVHIYREMRLTFREIVAKDHEDAARIAHDLSLMSADELDECDGETFAALVDVDDDNDYELSRIIDFEGERLRKAAPKLLQACQLVVDRWQHGDLAEAARACQEAITHVVDAPIEPPEPIVIEVLGGVVQQVQNVPTGYEYEIKDYDDLKADEEAARRPA